MRVLDLPFVRPECNRLTPLPSAKTLTARFRLLDHSAVLVASYADRLDLAARTGDG